MIRVAKLLQCVALISATAFLLAMTGCGGGSKVSQNWTKVKTGYEIPFTRHFYKYVPPRPLGEIDADLEKQVAKILDLLRRAGGATAKELQTATGWQPHSVRGFLSGTIGKKMGLTVTSSKSEDGERSYSIKD